MPRNERDGDRSVSRLTIVRRVAANQARKEDQRGHAMPGTIARNEMDSLADTSCAGPNWALIELTGQVCNVTGFMDSGQTVNDIPIATCATIVIDNDTGQESLLIGHEMLYFGSLMKRSLLNPNQLRYAGVQVRDDPTREREEGFGLRVGDVQIPFSMEGTITYFESRHPTQTEIEDMSMPHQVITREEEWDPKRVQLREISNVQEEPAVVCELERCLSMVSSCYVEEDYQNASTRAVRIGRMDTSNSRHSKVTPQDLSRTLRIGLDTATKTLRATTQRGVHTALHPITRRYRVDHLAFNRKRLGGNFYTDGLKSSVTSLDGNNYAQVFTNGKYTAVYPMKARREAGSKLRAFV